MLCFSVKEYRQANSEEAIKTSYDKDVTDEFVEPTITNSDPDSRIKDNDSIIFFNYRPDRAREITRAMTFENFDGFQRKAVRKTFTMFVWLSMMKLSLCR